PPVKHPLDHQMSWDCGRTLSEYQIVYITRGSGEFESADHDLKQITAGNIFILFPGIWHRYKPDRTSGWDEYWVAFQGNGIAKLLTEYGFSVKEPVMDVGVLEFVLHEFRQITEELNGEKVGYQRVIAARTVQIMANTHAAIRRKEFEGTDIQRIIEKAKSLLSEQIQLSVNVEQLASSLHVGYSWFRRMFRQYVGMPPAQYQLQLRLNRACELLRNSLLPVGVIAEQTGFLSSYYFARVFRKKFGRSPTAFRKKAG
ncbi:MAG: AraC family transcriptional regulator, partial [Kiritimatiellae bacterium]|nr:AraC family transcriptional regulator [Kiritimatiellia bacterium]